MVRWILALLAIALFSGASAPSVGSVASNRRRSAGSAAWYDSVASGATDTNTGGNSAAVIGAKVTAGQSGTCDKVRIFIPAWNFSTTVKMGLFDLAGNLMSSGSTAATTDITGTFLEVTLGVAQSVTNSTVYRVGSITSNDGGVSNAYLAGQTSGLGWDDLTIAYAGFPPSTLTITDVTSLWCVGMHIQ